MTSIEEIYDAAWLQVVATLDQMVVATHRLMTGERPQSTAEQLLEVHCHNMVVLVIDLARLTLSTASGADADVTPDELRTFFNAAADKFAKETGN